MRRALCCAGIWMLLLGSLSSSPAAAGAQTFSEATDVVVVEVPVQVIGADGKPVRGLTADNFEVYEGRKRQPLVGFEALDLQAAPAAQQAGTPVAARRHFLMLFDISFSLPKSILQARGAARELVDQLHPSDLVSVASYSTTQGAKILLGFTGDKDQILAAVDRLGVPTLRADERPADPLGLIAIPELLSMGPDGGSRMTGGKGRSGDIAGTEIEQAINAAYNDQRQVTQERAVVAMSRSYGELARIMSGVRGRKHVVLFSEGFDGAVLTGTANVDDQNRMAETEIWNISSTARFGSSKATAQVESMLEEFRRADCIIQAVDIGGLRGGSTPSSQWVGGKDSLFLMAKETGGELFENHNQLGVAVAKVLERTSVTYVLAFQPDVPRDGAYHRLKVTLKDAPKGSRLVHRPGYYAPRPFDQQSPIERALVAGQAVLSGEDRESIGLGVLAAPFPAEGGPYVPVLIEVDGKDLLAGVTARSVPLDIYTYAFDPEGRVRAFFSQTMNLDLAKVEPALRQSGIKFFGHLDLPPGDWSLRTLVRNGATGAMGIKVATVRVPDFSGTAPVLLPPLFPEAPDKWLIVREAPRKGDRTVPYPFLAGEEPFVPASMPEIAAGRPAKVSLVGWNLPPGEIRAEARILTADGREAGTGEISGVQRLGAAADGSERLAATFAAPASLQPGEYVLMVTLAGAGGSETSVTSFIVPGARKG